jgi:hypothetical protein
LTDACEELRVGADVVVEASVLLSVVVVVDATGTVPGALAGAPADGFAWASFNMRMR